MENQSPIKINYSKELIYVLRSILRMGVSNISYISYGLHLRGQSPINENIYIKIHCVGAVHPNQLINPIKISELPGRKANAVALNSQGPV